VFKWSANYNIEGVIIMDKNSRKRKVDVEKLDDEQLAQIIKDISDNIVKMVDETVEKANTLLNIYGLETKMKITFCKKKQRKGE
jgi:ethanolamine utilization protein EutA (predicted chaperonin)